MLAGSVDLFVNSNKNSCDIILTAGPVGLFLIRKGCDIGFNISLIPDMLGSGTVAHAYTKDAPMLCVSMLGA